MTTRDRARLWDRASLSMRFKNSSAIDNETKTKRDKAGGGIHYLIIDHQKKKVRQIFANISSEKLKFQTKGE